MQLSQDVAHLSYFAFSQGLDCYRTYELYFLGVIPIVFYRKEHEELFRGLPILQLETWDLTQAELVGRMRAYVSSSEFLETSFDGWDRLFLQYWRTQVLNETGRLDDTVSDDAGNLYYKSWTYTRYREPYTKTYWPPREPIETIEDIL